MTSAIEGLRDRPVRPSVVKRIGTELQAGTYDPPVEVVVERLLAALVPDRVIPPR